MGHGIEALLTPAWLHGEAVSVGMVKELEISRAKGMLAADALSRILSILKVF